MPWVNMFHLITKWVESQKQANMHKQNPALSEEPGQSICGLGERIKAQKGGKGVCFSVR